jgi:Ca-activated chloride channel family protein
MERNAEDRDSRRSSMRHTRVVVGLFSTLIALFVAVGGAAQERGTADKTLSPYFFVQSDNPDTDRLPLRSTSARAAIAGVIADVTVTQEYKNEGKRPIEAIYVFPASTRAAVHAMKMTVGSRVIVAEIRKREDARREYEQARQEGKSATLLEQQRPNVFQMNVANIMPGDLITVELQYTELLVPDGGEYAFLYPTVAGPRYSHTPAEDAPESAAWVQNPFLHQAKAPTYSFDISLRLDAGMPIKGISSPSHKVRINYEDTSRAVVKLDPLESAGGNRDFVLRYRLADDTLQTGLLLFDDGNNKYFLLTAQPPARVKAAQVTGREYIFIMDVSGSMEGYPLDISKRLLSDLISGLKPTDTFNVLLFAGGSRLMAERSVAATAQNARKATAMIDAESGGGGTELLPALRRALALPRTQGYSRTVVITTDGYVDVEAEAFDLVRNNLGEANMFAFGIGTSVNRLLIEGLARVGMGEPFVALTVAGAREKAEAFRTMISSPVLTGVRVGFSGFDAYDVEPPSVPDVFAERPVIVFGKWRGGARGTIAISGRSAEGAWSRVIDVSRFSPSKDNSALRYLWARSRIALLPDYNNLDLQDSRVKEVTDLGLAYHLLTAYTSFVAVDSEVRNRDGNQATVRQALPLPEGVSDFAVGGSAQPGSAPAGAMTKAATGSGLREMATDEESDGSMPTLGEKETRTAAAVMRIGAIVVKGGLAETDVRSVLERLASGLLAAFGKAVPGGKGDIRIIIAADGSIKDVKILTGGSGDARAQADLLAALKAIRFPASTGGKDTETTVSISVGT